MFLAACFFLERVIPRNRTISSFVQFRTGILWLLANIVLLPLIIAKLSDYVGQVFSLKGLSESSFAIQLIVGFFLLDFFKYVIHYGFHRLPMLWAFHKVHHSIEYLTALSSFRISWVEGITNILASAILCALLGLHFEIVFLINMISISICMLQHANIKIPFTNILEKGLVTPDNHKYHHSKKLTHTYGQNFGFVLNIWDRIFKTYDYPKDAENIEIGLADEKFSDRFEHQFLYPLIKKQ